MQLIDFIFNHTTPVIVFIGGIFYWIYCFIVTYHLSRFGIGVPAKKLSIIFLVGSALIFSVVLILSLSVNLNLSQVPGWIQNNTTNFNSL